MFKYSLIFTLSLIAMSLYGCATTLQPGAEKIQTISAAQKQHCKFLGNITTQQKLGPDKPGNAFKKALNQVNNLGGDSLYVISTSTNWADGASFVGEAYKCNK